MKKIYEKPAVELLKVDMQASILAGSGGLGFDDDTAGSGGGQGGFDYDEMGNGENAL